jgi:glycosyltransferase involved in cell wall biosynthesis
MKILFPHSDSFGGFGGIAKYNRDLITALCSLPECEEVVALPRLAPDKIGSLPERLTYLLDGLGGKLKFTVAVLSAAWHKRPFDPVICGHINLLPVAWLCSKISGGRLGLMIYGIDAWQPTGSWLVNNLVKKIDFFISISEFTKQKFCSWSEVEPDKGHILPNSIDLEEFTPGPKNPALIKRYNLENKKVIMSLGRMSASECYKGFDEVLEALPELSGDIPEIAYLLVGDGDDRPRLESKARELGLADRVVFAGRIKEEEKVDHYRLADVFAMPSHGEGFGFVFLEAMACGIPSIGSKVDGSRDALLNGELGPIVDPEVPEEIMNAIRTAVTTSGGVDLKKLTFFSFNKFKERLMEIIA